VGLCTAHILLMFVMSVLLVWLLSVFLELCVLAFVALRYTLSAWSLPSCFSSRPSSSFSSVLPSPCTFLHFSGRTHPTLNGE
jgi:hypothetical protein